MSSEQDKREAELNGVNSTNDSNDTGTTTTESVEEAVLKYVRDGFQENDLNKDKAEGDDGRDGDEVTGNDSNNDNNQTGNNSSVAADDNDMSWYLRHEEDINQYDSENNNNQRGANRGNSSGTPSTESVAMAAVAAAYASTEKAKRKRAQDDLDNYNNGDHKHKSLKTKDNRDEKSGDKKDKDPALAVDPELATLDDNDNETAQDQLVRKAIIDTDSITQNPDFQQYLNTDISSKDDQHSKKTNEIGEKSLEKNNELDINLSKVDQNKSIKEDSKNLDDRTEHLGVSVSTQEPHSNKQYAELSKDYSDVLPKGMSISDVALKTDADTHLLQHAATKASELLGTTAASNGKAFDTMEESALDQFIEQYSKIKNFTRQQTCERIWTNGRRKDDFWINICKVLPYRTRSSIYKHVRRRYHIFEQRGKWTPEEDAQLAKLCLEKEGQWSEVGRVLGRMPEDCRDRWRNYIKCGSNRASNKWTSEEEERLKTVIADMLKEADDFEDRKESGLLNSEELETNKNLPRGPKGKRIDGKPGFKDIINWTVVSERMGGTRSRIQCRYKWNKLVKKQASHRIQNIPDDTKRWILEKLRDLGFTEDSQVDWDELATLSPDPNWSGLELKLCYEKMRNMVKNYKDKNINEISRELLGTTMDKNE